MPGLLVNQAKRLPLPSRLRREPGCARLGLALLASTLATAVFAQQDGYPSRPITIVVPVVAGSGLVKAAVMCGLAATPMVPAGADVSVVAAEALGANATRPRVAVAAAAIRNFFCITISRRRYLGLCCVGHRHNE